VLPQDDPVGSKHVAPLVKKKNMNDFQCNIMDGRITTVTATQLKAISLTFIISTINIVREPA
jgi:hypothetical protein